MLLPFDVERAWSAILPHCGGDRPPSAASLSRLLHETRFGSGGISGTEFHQRLAEEVGLRLSGEEFRRAWSDMFWEDEEVRRLIEAAPVRYRFLLSNTNEACTGVWITETYPHVFHAFDRLLVSHECGCEKPDPAIYRRVFAETKLPPEQHLFIDDIAENVGGARAVGMDAVLHTNAAALRREFERRGLA